MAPLPSSIIQNREEDKKLTESLQEEATERKTKKLQFNPIR